MPSKITIPDLVKRKAKGPPIAMVTAYDYTLARLLDEAGADVLLVGDSLGMVVQGHGNTLKVTLEQMAYHTACVARAAQRAHVVADMPFGSYHLSVEQAVESAIYLVQEGMAEAVKLEGGLERVDVIRGIVGAEIPVVGHVGLTPQSVHKLGGFKVQGKGAAADKVLEDAIAVAEAGAYCIVLETIPMDLARRITEAVSVPTIGIGAGVHCDGQVLVCYDLLGANAGFKPKFLKTYADLHGTVTGAVQRYVQEVQERSFPDDEHSFGSAKKGVGEDGGGLYGKGSR